jgi:DNA-binding HxlR family transcriptional regulator
MSDLVALFHHQWSLAVLAELLHGEDKRAAGLSRSLHVSRQTLLDTLGGLAEQGLVEERDGSWALTRRGERVADRGEAVLKSGIGAQRKWSLPILHALARKAQRFGELKAALPGATPRALSMALKDLVAAGLVERRVLDGFPPRTEYALQQKARAVAPLLEQMARA